VAQFEKTHPPEAKQVAEKRFRRNFTSAAKANIGTRPLIAAVNRCATQNQVQDVVNRCATQNRVQDAVNRCAT
jgi:hypothetical protein